jgi:hypothetical protein
LKKLDAAKELDPDGDQAEDVHQLRGKAVMEIDNSKPLRPR